MSKKYVNISNFRLQYKVRKVGFHSKKNIKRLKKWDHSRVKASRIRKSINMVEKFRKWRLLVMATGLGSIPNWRTLCSPGLFPQPQVLAPEIAPRPQTRKAEASFPNNSAQPVLGTQTRFCRKRATKAGKPPRMTNRLGVKSIKPQRTRGCRSESRTSVLPKIELSPGRGISAFPDWQISPVKVLCFLFFPFMRLSVFC